MVFEEFDCLWYVIFCMYERNRLYEFSIPVKRHGCRDAFLACIIGKFLNPVKISGKDQVMCNLLI